MELNRTLIVPASNVEQARAICDEHPDCQGMLTTALSANGEAPATHYVSAGWLPEEIITALDGLAVSHEGEPMAVISELGLMLCAPSE